MHSKLIITIEVNSCWNNEPVFTNGHIQDHEPIQIAINDLLITLSPNTRTRLILPGVEIDLRILEDHDGKPLMREVFTIIRAWAGARDHAHFFYLLSEYVEWKNLTSCIMVLCRRKIRYADVNRVRDMWIIGLPEQIPMEEQLADLEL